MEKLKIFIIGFVGIFGAILLMNEYDNGWTMFGGIVCLILAVCLYCRWNVNGELDDNKYI